VYFNHLRRATDPPAAKPARLTADGKPADPKDDNPKIETVSCTPAPEEAREAARVVWFQEVVLDETGKVVKHQHITAKELYLHAGRKDPEKGEVYQMVIAHGPDVRRPVVAGRTEGPRRRAGQRPSRRPSCSRASRPRRRTTTPR